MIIKDQWLKEGIAEYEKRMKAFSKLELVEVIDEKAPESITKKSKEDLQKKLQEGFDDEHYFSRIKLNRGANEGNIKNNL